MLQPNMLFFLGLMMLVIGIEELQKGGKRSDRKGKNLLYPIPKYTNYHLTSFTFN
jgi:Protein of unknown function (DUF3953)